MVIELIERVVGEVGHAATSDEVRLPLALAALRPQAAALASTDPEPGLDPWYSGVYRRTGVLDGYRDALPDRRPAAEIRRRVNPTAESETGRKAAEWLCAVSGSLEPYRFDEDRLRVARRVFDQHAAPDGPPLDALGWDVFLLLWQARGGDLEGAVSCALDHGRRDRVRLDLLGKQRRDLGLPPLRK